MAWHPLKFTNVIVIQSTLLHKGYLDAQHMYTYSLKQVLDLLISSNLSS